MDPQSTDINLPNAPVPLFPLPGVFLFPHQVLPLHVFEPRYRAMVRDLLDGPGRLVIASTAIGGRESTTGEPAVVPVAGLGEILRHEHLADGRYLLWVVGLCRVHLQEVASERPYRLVECLPFVETAVPAPEAAGLARELRAATTARLKDSLPLPDSTPPGLLADLLVQTLQPERALVERAFAEPDVRTRARLALQEAARRTAHGDETGPGQTGDDEDGDGENDDDENGDGA